MSRVQSKRFWALWDNYPRKKYKSGSCYLRPGEITENDVELAAASDAVIVGFSTTMATGARQAADNLGVDVRDYDVIYKLLEDIRDAMEGLAGARTG
jgi:translation initiation factor IF-2